jgi:ribosomal protein S6 kinase alpha-5
LTGEEKEAGAEPAATATDESLHGTSRIGPSHFDLLRVLGQGGFATVYLARKKGGSDDGRLYAMKLMDKDWIIEHNCMPRIIKERIILEALRDNPYVTKLHYAFQTNTKICLVLDYMSGGDLATATLGGNLTEDDVRIYIGELILAVEQLHKSHIIHRDISLENILLDSEGHVVISDFGLSRMFHPCARHRTYSRCGRVMYMAPEVLARSAEGYDMTVDWWSVGILTCELLTGRSPFQRELELLTKKKLASRVINEEPCIPDGLSRDAADFISKLLVKDPQNRLGAGEYGADELKRHPFFKGITWRNLAQRKYLAPFVPPDRNE